MSGVQQERGVASLKSTTQPAAVKKTISSARAGLELQSRLLFDSQIIEPCTLSYQEVSLAVNHHGVYSGLRCIVKLYRKLSVLTTGGVTSCGVQLFDF